MVIISLSSNIQDHLSWDFPSSSKEWKWIFISVRLYDHHWHILISWVVESQDQRNKRICPPIKNLLGLLGLKANRAGPSGCMFNSAGISKYTGNPYRYSNHSCISFQHQIHKMKFRYSLLRVRIWYFHFLKKGRHQCVVAVHGNMYQCLYTGIIDNTLIESVLIVFWLGATKLESGLRTVSVKVKLYIDISGSITSLLKIYLIVIFW